MVTADSTLDSLIESPPRYRWTILAVVLVSQVLASSLYLVWGSLTPFLRAEFALTREQVGLIVGAATAGGMIASTPFGRVGDRIGARRTLIGGFATMAGLGVFLSFGQSFVLLLVTTFAIGLGYGAINPNGIKVLVPWFRRQELGTAVALKQGGFPLGGAFAAATLPVLTLALGSWRLPVVGLGVLIALAAFVSYALLRERPAGRPRPTGPAPRWWTVVLRRDVLLLNLIGTLYAAAQAAWLGHFVLFSQEHLQLPVTVGAGLLAVSQFASVAGCFLLGFLSDRLFGSRRRELLIACGLVAAAVFLATPLMAGAPIWLLGLLAVAYGLSGGSWPPLRLATLAAFGGERSSGILVGLGMATGSLGGALAPPLFGRAVDTIGAYGPAWQATAGIAMLGALLAIMTREPRRPGAGSEGG